MKSLIKIKKKDDAKDDPVLRIDCRNCHEPSLGDIGCIRCLGCAIADHGSPERILLRTGTETELCRDTVEILRRISDSFCRTSIGRDGRRCSGCVLSSESLESEKWADFSVDNIDEILGRLDNVFVECQCRDECKADAIRYFSILRDRLEGISKDAAVAAYRIVGA